MATNKLLRITQMNAVYFDNEIFTTLKQHISELYKYLPASFSAKYDPEINLFLRSVITYYSVMSHDCTFGQKLLSIKYSSPTNYQKVLYLFSNCFDYCKEHLEHSNTFNGFSRLLLKVDWVLQLLRFINISIFLRNGVKPRLVERVLGLEQIYSKPNSYRHYEDKYMTRELVWNGLIEMLVYLLPLVNYHKVVRIARSLNPLHKGPSKEVLCAMPEITKDSVCSYCDEKPVIPVHMGCGHIFCYACLSGNQLADSKYECPECEFRCVDKAICEKVFPSLIN